MSTFNRKLGIFIPIIVGIISFSYSTFTAQASQLKNIRIGKHPDHTRIVFEFDSPVKAEHILSKTTGQLTVVFEGATVGLKRKISIEKYRQIKELQIWVQGNELSTKFLFNFEHFRLNSFQLTTPPRIAIDIFPIIADGALTPESTIKNSNIISKPYESNGHPEQTSSDSLQSTKATQQAGVPSESPTKAIDIAPSESDHPAGTQEPPSRTADRRTNDKPKPPRSYNLHFFLVIGLVVLSIIILVLLLLMLLFRHHWLGDKIPLKSIQSFKQQDEHIASLNARIHEELKRYEEA